MDDILREITRSWVEQKLEEINNIHKNLEFTLKTEVDHNLSFLDMQLIHDHETGKLSSTWYFKPTDSGLIMNNHALSQVVQPFCDIGFYLPDLQCMQFMAEFP